MRVPVIMVMVIVAVIMSMIVVIMVVIMIMSMIVGVAMNSGVVMVGVPGGVFSFSDGQFDSDDRFHIAASVVAVRNDQPDRSPLRVGEGSAVPLVDQDSFFNRLSQRNTGGEFSILRMERHMVGLGEGIRLL